MASGSHNGLKVARLATDNVEQVDMAPPREALDEPDIETRLALPLKLFLIARRLSRQAAPE